MSTFDFSRGGFPDDWSWRALIPGTGTAPVALGLPHNATGTISHPAIAATNLMTSTPRFRCASAATAGASAGTRAGFAMVWRGSSTLFGGFQYMTIFGTATAVADQRAFVGLYATASVIGNVNPSSLLNIVGMSVDNAQNTWRIIHNDGSGTATAIDLGANFPVNTTALYQLKLLSPPNGAFIRWEATRLDADFTATGIITTDMPANTAMLAPQIWINNGATASAAQIDVVRTGVKVP